MQKSRFQRGQMLLVVVLTMIVALTVGLSVVSRTITGLRISKQNEESQRAFQAAEAGIEKALQSGSTGNLNFTFTANNSKYNTSVLSSLTSGTDFLLNGGEAVTQDSGMDVWLANYPSYSSPYSGTVTLLWNPGTKTSCTTGSGVDTAAAIEVSVISGNVIAPPSSTSTPTSTGVPQVNLALNKTATAVSSCSASEGPTKAVNGTINGGNSDKWCSNSFSTKWLQVDLGANYNVNSFVIKHAGAGGESPTYNTSAYNIQTSTDGSNWTTVSNTSGNVSDITTNNITPTVARYVRLNVTNGGADGIARIYEFEVYGAGGGATSAPTPTPVTQTVNLPVVYDGWVESATSNCNPADTNLNIEGPNEGRSYMKFNTTSIPDNATITGVTLRYSVRTAGDTTSELSPYAGSGSTDPAGQNCISIINNTAPLQSYTSSNLFGSTGRKTVALPAQANSDLKSALNLNRFSLAFNAGVFSNNLAKVYSLETGTDNGNPTTSTIPYLTVTYTVPSSTPTSANTPTSTLTPTVTPIPGPDLTLTKTVFDPCPGRTAGAVTPGGSGTAGGINNFNNSAAINLTSGLIAKVVPLYGSSIIGIKGSIALPSQGKIVDSTGTSQETVRKVRYFSSNPQIPFEIFPYSILSQ